MALEGFVKAGSYSRINTINVSKGAARVDFDLAVYESNGGEMILGPLVFAVDYANEINKYKAANPVSVTVPEYPQVCADREAMVPMWTEGTTEEEITEYETAKDQYESDMTAYNIAVNNAETALDASAEAMNEYTQFFSDQKIYVESNATAQAYNYLKTQPGFESVTDA
ncbi:MAG: hypothetical protein MI799_15665 [Desulfobacterales bacterium]|nr:hypothetical protein [Desulfobacterales bacterium]